MRLGRGRAPLLSIAAVGFVAFSLAVISAAGCSFEPECGLTNDCNRCDPSLSADVVGDDCGFFVSRSSGDDANDGSKARPLRTLDRAIALASAYPALPQGRRIELGIRPEFVRLAPGGAGLPVRVRRVDDIGRARIARVEMAGRPLAASVPEAMGAVGEEASLVLDPHHIHIYADGHLVAGEGAP